MTSSDWIALGSTSVALAALALTAYLARLNLRHQRLEAHRGRMWERKVDILLEFLEWLEAEAAVGKPQAGGGDAVDRAPRLPDSLYVRVAAFAPDGFMGEQATACLAIGQRRQALAQFDEGKASRTDVDAAALEADRNLEYMRALVRNEVKMAPYLSEKFTPALLRALRERRRSTDG